MLRTCFLVWVVFGLGACARSEEGGLHVVIDGPLAPGRDFDQLSVIARLARDGTPLSVEVFDASSLTALPVTLNLLSGPGTPSGTRVEVFASAEWEGVVRSVVRGEGELTGGEGGRLELTLPPLPVPPETGSPVEVCANGLDDDADGAADCADADCDAQPCTREGGLSCGGGSCRCPGGEVGAYAPRSGFTAAENPMVALVQAGARAGQVAIATSPVSEVQFFNPVSLGLETVQLGETRTRPTLAANAEGLAIVGGVGESSFALLSAAGDQFESHALDPTLSCEGATAVGVGTELVLLGGRLAGEGEAMRSNAIFTLALGEASHQKLGEVGAACLQSAARIGSGAVLAVGSCETGTPSSELTIASVSDSVSEGALQTGPTLPLGLAAPAVASLSGDRVLIVGGWKEASHSEPNERAFLVTRSGGAYSLREIAQPPLAMGAAAAVTLENGWVFVAEKSTGRAFWFDPASETFVPGTNLPGMRTDFGMVALQSNAALIIGGEESGSPATTAFLVSLACP